MKAYAKDIAVKKLCEENLLYPEIETEMHPVLLENTLFKNPFCILCNGPLYKLGINTFIDICTNLKASQLERDRCHKDPVYSWWYPYMNLACYNCKEKSAENFYFKIGSLQDMTRSELHTMFYRQLFSISRDNVIVLHNQQCTDGTYDSKTVRHVVFLCVLFYNYIHWGLLLWVLKMWNEQFIVNACFFLSIVLILSLISQVIIFSWLNKFINAWFYKINKTWCFKTRHGNLNIYICTAAITCYWNLETEIKHFVYQVFRCA